MSDSNDDDDENTFGPFISPDMLESMQKALGPVTEASLNAAETYQPAAERMAKEQEKLEPLRGTLEHVAAVNETAADALAPTHNAMPDLESVFEAAQKLDSVTESHLNAIGDAIGQAGTPTGGASRRRRRSATTTTTAADPFATPTSSTPRVFSSVLGIRANYETGAMLLSWFVDLVCGGSPWKMMVRWGLAALLIFTLGHFVALTTLTTMFALQKMVGWFIEIAEAVGGDSE
ncbi:hypothetical protein [Halopelagius fulvigenes]|uniref:Uncharacterized protein n=1 Tax=Halopelagius fulvigenes TaxID=1198324 RepID=A0ABD5TZ12_9EURY